MAVQAIPALTTFDQQQLLSGVFSQSEEDIESPLQLVTIHATNDTVLAVSTHAASVL